MRISRATLAEDAAMMAAAAVGGGALALAGVPAGWLTGAMLAVALAGTRRRWSGPSPALVNLGMLLSGVVIGSSATPEAIALLMRNPVSLALLILCLAATMVVTGLVLERAGWTRLDAALASAPGALSAVMAVARATGAGTPRIAVVQLFRLFLLVAVGPSLLAAVGVGAAPSSAPPEIGRAFDIAAMLAAGAVAGLAFWRLGMMAPMILGATLSSALLHGTGLVHGTLPAWLALPGFVIVGAMIGARFGTVSLKELVALLPIATLAFVASTAVAAAFAALTAALAGVSFGVAFVAFAPGGLEAMALLAVLLGLDPLFVGAHHMVRFMAVGLLLPLVIRLIRPGERGEDR